MKYKGIVGYEALALQVANFLVTAGFTVKLVDGAPASAVGGKRIVVQATTAADPKAEAEPWSVVVEGNDIDRWISINVCTPTQINEFGVVALTGVSESGRISRDSLVDAYWGSHEQWDMDAAADLTASPMTLFASATDHGFALCAHVEGRTNNGISFCWLCVQRPVDQAFTVPQSAPLFAVYRTQGDGNPDVLDPKEIQRITVREPDINTPTAPVTACSFAPDVHPIINCMQQVGVTYSNGVVVQFPQQINTQRHVHTLCLDMLGYCSADIISEDSSVPLLFTGQPERVYSAQPANGANNRGVRILFPQ